MPEVTKLLASTDKKRTCIKIPRGSLHLFPTGGPTTTIRITFGNKGEKNAKNAHLDSYGRLYVGAEVFRVLGLDEPDAVVSIAKEDKSYRISKIR